MSEEVEADVNREVLRVARQSGLKTVDELRQKMSEQGEKLSEVQETLRRHFYRQAVLQNDVDRRIYFSITEAEATKYHTENRNKFQGVTLSEIFLSLAGRDEAEVLNKARQIVAEGRAGKDFTELVARHSEREDKDKTKGLLAMDDKGKARSFLIAELNGPVGDAVKDLKAGGVSEPVKMDEGYVIFRVNERDDAFNERQVRSMMTQERSEKEREEFLRTLRQNAYIKPATNYAALIQPLLDKDIQSTAKTSNSTASKNSEDKKNQKQ